MSDKHKQFIRYVYLRKLAESLKYTARLVYGEANLYNIAKVIKHVTGVGEYTAYLMALVIDALEDILK